LRKKLHKVLVCILLFCGLLGHRAVAQSINISGTVYDISARRPLEAVAVMSTSGRGTISDSMGRYSLRIPLKDSIWFSMIGKSTMKYPVDTISNTESFNVMIHVRAFDLPDVKVRNNYYKFDSVQNRKDYAKIFDFKKPGLRLSNNPGYNPGGVTVGFDLDEIINMFRFKRNRSLLNLQNRLLQQEQDKYVDHRYTKPFVRKLTKLNSPELDTFMRRYRPDYEIMQQMNDLELGYYIEKTFDIYKSEKAKYRGSLRRRDD